MTTPDSILRELWAVSLALRAIALAIGAYRKAPVAWMFWCAWYLGSGILLRIFEVERNPAYMPLWIAQQIGICILGVWLVRDAARPTGRLVFLATASSIFVANALSQPHYWPDIPMETAMQITGTFALALGIVATFGALAQIVRNFGELPWLATVWSLPLRTIVRALLRWAWAAIKLSAIAVWRSGHAVTTAIFFLLYSILLLAGADHLHFPYIGRGWEILEIVAFGSWAVLFATARK